MSTILDHPLYLSQAAFTPYQDTDRQQQPSNVYYPGPSSISLPSCLYTLPGHRPPTTVRQRLLSWTILSISVRKLYPTYSMSVMRSRPMDYFWPSSFPLALSIPCKGLSCDAGCRFLECVPNPTPTPSFYFNVNGLLYAVIVPHIVPHCW